MVLEPRSPRKSPRSTTSPEFFRPIRIAIPTRISEGYLISWGAPISLEEESTVLGGIRWETIRDSATSRRKIKCPETLWILEEVITSIGGETNVPIGNYLSQYFGNIYLNKKTQIFAVDKVGIDFLGYRHFRNYTLLRKSSAQRFKKKIRYIEEHHATMPPQKIVSSVMSYYGWLKHCDSYNLQRKYLFENPKILNIMDRAADDLGIRNPLLKAMEGAASTPPH